MNEQLQIRVGLFLVTVGQGAQRRNDWRSEREQAQTRFPLAHDGQYTHNRIPPQFVFEHRWRDYTRRVVLKKNFTKNLTRAVRSYPDQCIRPSTSGETP